MGGGERVGVKEMAQERVDSFRGLWSPLSGRPLTVFVLLAGGVLALATACGSSQSTPATPSAPSGSLKAIPVNVAPATLASISITTTFPATVDFAQQVNLSPLTAGRIEKVYVELGAQ